MVYTYQTLDIFYKKNPLNFISTQETISGMNY